ncbi:MAG: alpha/beta fold hydrolase [Candidatus Omnitrophica bacterium]|nr:alpha/beta fold hydrolase [Candidatus Omnitrophota bacterium]
MSIEFSFSLKKNSSRKSNNANLEPSVISGKDNNGPIVILIHGLTGTPHEMSFLAGFLKRAGYLVICPRLANHGQPIEILKDTTWQDFYRSVRDIFVETMKQDRPVFVSGLSMGALLALLLAEEFPDKVSGVSCLSPTIFYDGWNVPWYTCFLPIAYHTPLKHFMYFKEEPPYGIKNETVRSHVHDHYSKAKLHEATDVNIYGYPYFPLILLYQLNLLVKHLSKKLGGITVPVQLIQAKEDDMTSVKNSQFIYDKISSKTKEIVLLNNSYHVITADQERDKVAREMADFFAKCKWK